GRGLRRRAGGRGTEACRDCPHEPRHGTAGAGVSSYSVLAGLRAGIAGRISADPGTASRASVAVTLRVTGTPVSGGGAITSDVQQAVQLYGPGDVVGVNPRAIVRTEPRNWITDVEPNFLAHIEFYDED